MSADRHSSSSGSQYSSPARSVSSFAVQSPVLAGALPPGNAKSKMTASKSAANRYSPPRPSLPVIRLESDYLVGESCHRLTTMLDSYRDHYRRRGRRNWLFDGHRQRLASSLGRDSHAFGSDYTISYSILATVRLDILLFSVHSLAMHYFTP